MRAQCKKNKLLFFILASLFIPAVSYGLIVPQGPFQNSQFGIIPEQGRIGITPPRSPILPENVTLDQALFQEQQIFIKEFQEKNSKFITALINEQFQLPYDNITIGQQAATYFNPTSVGLWLVYLANVAKGNIVTSLLTPDGALVRLNQALDSIVKMPKWNGLLGWSAYSGSTIRKTGEASAFDNANYAASLGVIYGAFGDSEARSNPLIGGVLRKVQQLLEEQKQGWRALYDSRRGLIYGDEFKGYHIDKFYNEGRLAPIMAIALANVSEDSWRNLKIVRGSYEMSSGKVAELVLPPQGAFQAYLPLIFLPEDEWSGGLKIAHQNYGAVQIDYANKTDLPALRSAASDPYVNTYVYRNKVGVPGASEDEVRGDIGTPHATALLNLIAADRGVKLMQELEEFTQGKIYGPYGMHDAVGHYDGDLSATYLSLDHLMMTVAMAGKINQEYFINFLNKIGKLKQVKNLYQGLNIPLSPVEIPPVKEFGIAPPRPKEPPPPATGLLIDFNQGDGRSGPHVPAFGVWDGPSGRIRERVISLDGNQVMEVTYDTPEYNGLWFKLTGLEPIGKYKELVFDIKASEGFNELKIELKEKGSIVSAALAKNIPEDKWITVKIPLASFNMPPLTGDKLKKIIDELVFVIEGWKLPSSQRKGTFYLDNLRLEK